MQRFVPQLGTHRIILMSDRRTYNLIYKQRSTKIVGDMYYKGKRSRIKIATKLVQKNLPNAGKSIATRKRQWALVLGTTSLAYMKTTR